MQLEILAQSVGNETPDWAVMGDDGSMAVFTQIVESTGQTFESDGWALVRINGGAVLLRYGAIDPSNPGNAGVSFHEPTRSFFEERIVTLLIAVNTSEDADAADEANDEIAVLRVGLAAYDAITE